MTLAARWGRHVQVATQGAGYPLSCAIRKYGKDSFRVEQIAQVSTYEALNFAEQYFIRIYQARVPFGYNVDLGGKGGIRPPEIGAKISAKRKGQKLGPYRPRSAEHCKKLSEARKGKPSWHKGRKRSDSCRALISKARKGRGHPHTREHKDRLAGLLRNEKGQFIKGWSTT